MDGLLIDSEPLWEEAELEVFRSVGVPLTREMTDLTLGVRYDEVVQHWFARYPWEGESPESVAERLLARVTELIEQKGEPRPGVRHAFETVAAAGLKIAIASSSPDQLIQAVVHKLGIKDHLEVIHSAENEPFGKPHPAVYITAAQRLGVEPRDCLTFEDSPAGVLSAKAAKMHCIAVPDAKMINDKRFAIADHILSSLNEVTPELLKGIPHGD